MMNPSPDAIAWIMERLGFQKIKVSARSVSACCRFHQESNPSFAVVVSAPGTIPYYRCFGCGAHGRLDSLVVAMGDLLGEDLFPVVSKIQETFSLISEIDEMNGTLENARTEELEYRPYQGLIRNTQKNTYKPSLTPAFGNRFPSVDAHSAPLSPPAPIINQTDLEPFAQITSEYLLKRGISADTQEQYGIRVQVDRAKVIFPIIDHLQTLHGYSVRNCRTALTCLKCRKPLLKSNATCADCGQRHPKYMHHPPGLQKSLLLYGEDQYQAGSIPILVEGFLDVLRPMSLGIDTIATPLAIMGGSPSWPQIRKITARLPPTLPLVTMGDSDDVGQKLNATVDEMLSRNEPGRDLITISLRSVKDPGEFESDHVNQIVKWLLDSQNRKERRSCIIL